jgi:hypothetical protein
MTSETKATIKILDNIGERKSLNKYSKLELIWEITTDKWSDGAMVTIVGYRNDKFFNDYLMQRGYGGFEMLERLAGGFSQISVKLAEPMDA